MRKLLLTLLACGGCIHYPGDGHLVIVLLDPAFSDHQVQDSDGTMVTEAQALADGIRFWDVVGAHLRTKEQLTTDDQPFIDGAPVLQVFRTDAIMGIDAGEYAPADGTITIFELSLATIAPIVRDLAAHETGHAVGLGHVADGDAVMYPVLHVSKGINSTDCREFRAHWDGPACPAR